MISHWLNTNLFLYTQYGTANHAPTISNRDTPSSKYYPELAQCEFKSEFFRYLEKENHTWVDRKDNNTGIKTAISVEIRKYRVFWRIMIAEGATEAQCGGFKGDLTYQ